MQPTITPTTERSPTIIRRRMHRPQQATHYPSAYGKSSRRAVLRRESMRSSVANAFRTMAHGVGAVEAEAQTKAFYRSGGQAWALKLECASSTGMRATENAGHGQI